MITGKALARRTFLRGVGTTIALPFLDAMTPAMAADNESACSYGLCLRAERHGRPQLEPRLRGQARRTVAHPEAAGAVQGRHPGAGQSHPQQRTRAAGWPRRSRPLLRLLSHRRSAAQDHGRHQGRHLLRPDCRQPDRQPDPIPLARTRPRRRAPGRRLRFRLLLRVHEQPRLAERDPAAAAGPRSARAV